MTDKEKLDLAIQVLSEIPNTKTKEGYTYDLIPVLQGKVDKLISPRTNSEYGSYHWFHTLVAGNKGIGEYLKEETPDEHTLRVWGDRLYNDSKELIEYYTKINKLNE
jgi:hypothetical protein